MPPITSGQEIGVRGLGAFWAIQHNFPSLHHCGYVNCPFGATCIEFRSMACTAQPVLAHSESLTQLCDSDHQVTPQFSGVLETSVTVRDASVLCEEIAVLLAKDAIETVTQAEMKSGFYSPSSCPRRAAAFNQFWICEFWISSKAPVLKLPFKMLMQRCIIRCNQQQD